MRYPASEKLEIIRLVEQSHLPVRRTHVFRAVKCQFSYRKVRSDGSRSRCFRSTCYGGPDRRLH